MTHHRGLEKQDDKQQARPLATRTLLYSTGAWDEAEIQAVTDLLRGQPESIMIGPNAAGFERADGQRYPADRGMLVSMNHSFDDEDIAHIKEHLEGFITERRG